MTFDDRLTAEEALHHIEHLADALHIIAYAVESDQCFDRHQTLANALYGLDAAISDYCRRIEDII